MKRGKNETEERNLFDKLAVHVTQTLREVGAHLI